MYTALDRLREIGFVAVTTLALYFITARQMRTQRQIESERHRSEDKFAKIFAASPDSILITVIDTGEVIDANDSFLHFMGYNRDELVGNTTLELDMWVNQDERKRLVELTRSVGLTQNLEVRLRRKSGEGVVGLIAAESIDLDGKTYLLSVIKDITDRKRTDEKLRVNEARMKALLTAIPDLMFRMTIDGVYLDFHDPDRETMIPALDFIGKHMSEVVPQHVTVLTMSAMQQVTETGKPTQFEYVLEDAGSEKTFEARLVPLEQGHEVLAIVRDVTERIQAELALRDSQARQKALLVAMPDPLFIIAPDSTILDFHGNAPDLRIAADKLVGTKLQNILLPEDVPHILEAIQQAKSQHTRTVSEFTLSVDGQKLYYEARLVPLEPGENVMAIVRNITERHTTEQALRASEERYRRISELISDYAYSYRVNADGSMYTEWVTDSYVRLTGYQIGEADRLGNYALYAPDEQARVDADIQAVIRGEHTKSDYRIRTKWGEERWLHVSRYPVWDETENRIVRFYGVAKDITASKNVEAALRQSEDQFRQFMHYLPASIFIEDEVGLTLYCNHLYARTYNATPDALIGKNVRDYIHPPELAEQYIRENREIVMQGTAREYQRSRTETNGTFTYWQTYKFPILRENQPALMGAISLNVTQQHQANMALRISEEKLSALIKSQTNYMIRTDMEGKYTYWNAKFEEDFGWGMHTNTPQSVEAIYTICEHHHERAAETVARCIDKPGTMFQVELDKPAHDGRILTTLWEFICLTDAEGNPSEIQCVGIDITDRVKAEKARHDTEMRYRQMFEVHGVPKLIINPQDGSIVDANPAAAQFYGYEQATLRTMTIFDVNLSPVEDVRHSMANATTGGVLSCVYLHRGADGSPHDVEVFTGGVEIEGKEYLYSIITDITQKVQAEAKLQETLDQLEQHVTERTAELEKTKDRLEAIFNHSADAILLLDVQEGIQQANYAFTSLFDVSSVTYAGVRLESFVMPEYSQKLQSLIGEVAEHHSTQHFETVARRTDGVTFDVEISLAPVNRSENAVTNLVCIIRDISTRKQAEHTLAEERNLLRTVIDAVPDYIYVKDTQHRMMLNNLAHVRATGMSSPGEMLGKTDFDLFPPDMAMKFHIDEVRVLNTGTPQHNLEEQPLNAEGNAIWALTTKVPLRNLQGEIVGLVGITHDITKLKASEQALRESEELYRTTIAAMTEGITLQKRDGSFTFCNVSAESILGLTNDQVMGRTRIDPRWRIIYEDGTRFPEEAQPAMLALRTGFPQPNVVMGVQNPDGSVRWILASAQPLFDPTQAMPTSVVTTFSDITERKRTEAALEEKHQQELLLQQQLKTLHEITIQLTRAETLDDFYRSTVEHGLKSFGFERMGLLLYDTERDLAMGTYGTDAHGQIMDERGLILNTTDLTGVLKRTLNRSERFAFDADVPLYSNMQEVGRGDNVVAALWNGEVLGWLCVDNLIHHQPITKTQQDILALYALTAGSLLSRKRAEFALRESEERYQSVVQTQSELICRYQPDLTLTFVNNAYCRYFNHSAEEIIGKSFLETIRESEREDVKAFYEKLVRTKGSVTYEHHVIMDDGSIRWQLWTDTTVVNESDEVVAIQAVGLDITDRKQAENALRESEKKFRSFIESAPISVLITDPNGEIVLANTEAVKVFGYPQTELIGQSIELLVPDSEKRQHVNSRTHYTLAPKSRRMGGLEVRARRKDGSHFPCEVQLSYVETHPTPLVMGFILDVTQQKEAELTLKQALAQEKELGELKSRFVSMASHEFRTPLAAILATTETLTIYRDKMNAQQIDIRLDKIRQQVMHMKDIMEDVLQLARIQAGRVKYEPTLGNLDMLCSEIIEEFENQSQYTGRITYTGVKLPELMFFDQRLMRQVITNVIGNALKYSSKEKPVYVDLQQNAAEIVLKVKDEGIGIPVEDIKHLFEPFHRAKNVGTISGTGLGMSISKQAVEIHGGTIMPESEVGVGTTMTIVLPLVSATISARTQDTE